MFDQLRRWLQTAPKQPEPLTPKPVGPQKPRLTHTQYEKYSTLEKELDSAAGQAYNAMEHGGLSTTNPKIFEYAQLAAILNNRHLLSVTMGNNFNFQETIDALTEQLIALGFPRAPENLIAATIKNAGANIALAITILPKQHDNQGGLVLTQEEIRFDNTIRALQQHHATRTIVFAQNAQDFPTEMCINNVRLGIERRRKPSTTEPK